MCGLIHQIETLESEREYYFKQLDFYVSHKYPKSKSVALTNRISQIDEKLLKLYSVTGV